MTHQRQGSWQQFDCEISYKEMVAVRDGTLLAADLYRPKTDTPVPALVERTPYSRQRSDLVASARYFARRGFAVVLQDVCGRGDSEGEWYPFANEGPDGYDSVEWTASQSWCNGKVGTIGLSYGGSDQHALANLAPPHLSAMFVSEGLRNYHSAGMRQGGAAELRFLIWTFHQAQFSPEARRDADLRRLFEEARPKVSEWLRHPFRAGISPLRHLPSYERWLVDVLTHGDYDDYWKQYGYNVEEHIDQHADVPIYFLTGWYDSYTSSSTENFADFRARKRGPARLIVGPWTHGAGTAMGPLSGDVDFGPESALDSYDDFRLRWFDRHLKGLDTGIDDELPVLIFVMGGGPGNKSPEGHLQHGGKWRWESEWPLARAEARPFYLHPDGHLRSVPPSQTADPTRYRFNPANPVPTIGGSISASYEVMLPGGFDQRLGEGIFGSTDHLPLAARPDVLVFQTDPLEEAMEVTGPIAVHLWGSSSAVDTDFTAKLIDVYPPSTDYPDGYALNLSDGIIRGRYRDSREAPNFLTPGEVHRFKFTLYPTSNLFARSHRIRLDISSSNFPRFDVNPNTGEPIGAARRPVIAENAIYHDLEHPSQIVLPVVPASEQLGAVDQAERSQ